MLRENKTIYHWIEAGGPEAEKEFQNIKKKISEVVNYRLRYPVEDRQDLVSEIFLATLENLKKGAFDPSKGIPLERYILGITVRKIAKYFVKVYREKKSSLQSDDIKLLDIPYETYEVSTLKLAINKLSPDERELIRLKFYEGLNYNKISDILRHKNKKDISVPAIRKRISRILEKIRLDLSKEDDT